MQKPIDSLKLSNQEWGQLIQTLDRQVRPAAKENRLAALRVGLPEGVLALMRPVVEGQPGEHFRIRCRNISSSGLAFMHGRFIHPGTPVQTIFVSASRQGMIVDGSIVRARLIDNHIHEIGVQFNEPLDLDEAIAMGLALPPTEEELALQREAQAKLEAAAAATAKNTVSESKSPDDQQPGQATDPATDNNAEPGEQSGALIAEAA